MNKLLVLSITAIFVLLCLQSCSKDDENQDEFLKEYNLPKGVTKPTIGWQYEEEVAKNALIAGFLNGLSTKESKFSTNDPRIQSKILFRVR